MALEGSYQVSAKTMMGTMDGRLDLAVEGDRLTGVIDAMGMRGEVKNGTVSGDSFVCQAEGDSPLGHLVADVKGSVAGDRITGTLKTGMMKVKFAGERIG